MKTIRYNSALRGLAIVLLLTGTVTLQLMARTHVQSGTSPLFPPDASINTTYAVPVTLIHSNPASDGGSNGLPGLSALEPVPIGTRDTPEQVHPHPSPHRKPHLYLLNVVFRN
jgi:hypothetical protein